MSQQKLHDGIIALSNAVEWHAARLEWRLKDVWMSDDPETCLCGHYPIREICVIVNKENGAEAEVGNCCVNNFLDINSEQVFSSLRKVVADPASSFNEATIELVYERGYISKWERDFYLDIWRKRVLSPKQAAKKERINAKILARLRR